MDSPVFILSTGRTGTQFFEEYINGTSTNAFCLHEPHPSRRFKFFSNMYLAGKISDERIVKHFLRCRRNILQKYPDKRYIESSNFMFGCIPSLNTRYRDIGVIHIIRHPETYVRSHLGHGFWKGYKKFFAKHVPYWLENLDAADRRNPIELLAARWVLVNNQVASYAKTNPYLRVQFEDLFSSNISSNLSEIVSTPKSSGRPTCVTEIERIREFCGLEPAEEEDILDWIGRPKNRSKRKATLSNTDRQTIYRITAEAASAYGYNLQVS